MARKVFWAVWMTVWPIVALAPHILAAARPAGPGEMTAGSNSPPVSRRQPAERSKTGVNTARIASAKESRIPLLAQADPVTEPKTVAPKLLSDDSQPVPAKKNPTTNSKTEALPPALQPPQLTVPSQPRTARKPISTTPRLTPQEERAQKLIHERAVLRGLERHTRLELKYRRNSLQHGTQPTHRLHSNSVRTTSLDDAQKTSR